MDFLTESLECTICLELSTSPIHNCSNGHIICGKCIIGKKIETCGICNQVEDKLVPCAFAERLIKMDGYRVPCPYVGFGCRQKATVQYTKIFAHIDSCKYKPFVCVFEHRNGCQQLSGQPGGNTCNMSNYYQHLKDVHAVVDFGGEERSFGFPAVFPPVQAGSSFGENVLHGTKKFDGHIFLAVTTRLENCITLKVVIIGGRNEAKNYKCSVKLAGPGFKSTGSLTVLSVADSKNDFFLKHLENCFTITAPGFRPFGMQFNKSVEVEIAFNINITIVKISN